MAAVLIGEQADKQGRAPITSEPALLWVVIAWTGLALAVVGWTDMALLWYPLLFGTPEWEFATISACYDAMPVGTVGLILMVAGAIGRGWRGVTRTLAVVSFCIALGLVAVSVVYLLDVPLALKGIAPPVKYVLKKAMLKAGVSAAAYTVLYAWLAWFLWRSTRLVKAQ